MVYSCATRTRFPPWDFLVLGYWLLRESDGLQAVLEGEILRGFEANQERWTEIQRVLKTIQVLASDSRLPVGSRMNSGSRAMLKCYQPNYCGDIIPQRLTFPWKQMQPCLPGRRWQAQTTESSLLQSDLVAHLNMSTLS